MTSTRQTERTRYITTEGGRKTGVVLTLKKYRQLIEDLEDLAVMAERRGEPSEPFEVVKKRLELKWRITGSK